MPTVYMCWSHLSYDDLAQVASALSLAESLVAAAAEGNWTGIQARYQASESVFESALKAISLGSKGFAFRPDRLVWMWGRRAIFGFPDGRWDYQHFPHQPRIWIPVAVLLSCREMIHRCIALVTHQAKPSPSQLIEARIDVTDRLVAMHEFAW